MLSIRRSSIVSALDRKQIVHLNYTKTQIIRFNTSCSLRRRLSTISYLGSHGYYDNTRSDSLIGMKAKYNIYGGAPMISQVRHGNLHLTNERSFGCSDLEVQRSIVYGYHLISAMGVHNRTFVGETVNLLQSSDPWKIRRRIIGFYSPQQLQFSYFSTLPSMKTKDDETTPPTSSTSNVANIAVNIRSTTTNTPLPSRTLGKTAVPTPPSAPPMMDNNPLQSLQGATPKSVIRKGVDLLVSGSKVVVTWIAQLPSNIFYYATHPTETKAAYVKIRDTVKHEIHHYWVGTKLLWADIVTARKLLGKTLDGSTLTRRERKQLLRTVSDLFRLIPFSMFVIVPFMEFALPFALRIFPNMLPSTYQDSLKAEENMKRELKSRIAMAQFFQE
jgi:LETM1-like protein